MGEEGWKEEPRSWDENAANQKREFRALVALELILVFIASIARTFTAISFEFIELIHCYFVFYQISFIVLSCYRRQRLKGARTWGNMKNGKLKMEENWKWNSTQIIKRWEMEKRRAFTSNSATKGARAREQRRWRRNLAKNTPNAKRQRLPPGTATTLGPDERPEKKETYQATSLGCTVL